MEIIQMTHTGIKEGLYAIIRLHKDMAINMLQLNHWANLFTWKFGLQLSQIKKKSILFTNKIFANVSRLISKPPLRTR